MKQPFTEKLHQNKIPISIRNISDCPIRVTIAISGSGRNDDKILITIGKADESLKKWYGACVDLRLEPDSVWQDVGTLNFQLKLHRLGIDSEATYKDVGNAFQTSTEKLPCHLKEDGHPTARLNIKTEEGV